MIKKIDSLKELVSNGDIDIALKNLDEIIKSIKVAHQKKLHKSYLLISSEINRLNEQQLQGTIDYDNFKVQHTKNIYSLLSIIDEIEKLLNKRYNVSLQKLNKEDNFWNKDNYEAEKNAFKRNFSNIYQSFPILFELNKSEKIIIKIIETLKTRKSEKYNYWIDNNNEEQFNLIYVNTSVLYFLLQLGFDLNHSFCDKSHEYLKSIKDISIENRAKWYFDIQTNNISSNNALKFTTLLEENQIKKHAFAEGAFYPFRQTSSKTKNITNLPTHYGGFSFHACLVSDVLFHLMPQHKLAKEKAINILDKTRNFLYNMAEDNEGYLLDGNFDKNPQYTTWYYFLSNNFGVPLPEKWQENILNILTIEEENMFKASFLIMNLSLIFIQFNHILDVKIKRNIIEYYEHFYNKISEHLENELENITSRDLSIYGRALLYANKALNNESQLLYNEIHKIV